MEFKVKAVDGPNTKSNVEVEEVLIAEAEAKHEGTEGESPVVESTENEAVVTHNDNTSEEEAPIVESGISDEDVLSFLNNKYGKTSDSLDDFNQVAESSDDAVELSDDVKAYLQYKNTTGRGMQDYLKLNRDLDSMDSDSLLKEYFVDTETDLDAEDIADLMEEFVYDEDTDEDADVRKVKRAKKKAIAKAKDYFTEQAKMYSEPTEQVAQAMSAEDSEGLQAYKQSITDAETTKEANELRGQAFSSATESLFSSEFKGFEFKIGEDVNLNFNVGTAAELREAQATPMNFINKYMDEDGMISDAPGYHKALAVAMNPEKFAQFFFEQGQAQAKDGVIRSTKNINMSTRTAPEVSTQGGAKVRAVPTTHGSGLKIKSRKYSN